MSFLVELVSLKCAAAKCPESPMIKEERRKAYTKWEIVIFTQKNRKGMPPAIPPQHQSQASRSPRFSEVERSKADFNYRFHSVVAKDDSRTKGGK